MTDYLNQDQHHAPEPLSAETTPSPREAAITELTTKWGYRDITALIAAWNHYQAQQFREEPRSATTYVCILQTPAGGPVYCRTDKRLIRELSAARIRNEPYERCLAPDPTDNMWMVVGNFEIDDEEEGTHGE